MNRGTILDFHAIFDNYKTTITDHYFDMAGRAGRSQFWYFVAANIVASLAAHIVGVVLHLPLGELYNLAVLLPATCIGARRLQDTGRNGMMVWVLFILAAISQVLAVITAFTVFLGAVPLAFLYGSVGVILAVAMLIMLVILIVHWTKPGDVGTNLYGAPPPPFDPSRPVTPAP